MLPDQIFSEGIYFSAELNELALAKIITEDLPEIKTALNKILDYRIYQQRIPIGHNTSKIYDFYYNECHLNFIRHSCYNLIELAKLRDFFDTQPITEQPSMRKLFFQAQCIYFINIGEAFTKLSFDTLAQFNPDSIALFKQARNILAHPERQDNDDKIKELENTSLNIALPVFMEFIKAILTSASRTLADNYNYKFNMPIKEIDYFKQTPANSDGFYDIASLPQSLQRVLFSYENLTRIQNSDDSDIVLATFSEAKDPSLILDETKLRTQLFEDDLIKVVKSNRAIDYYDAIAYLEDNHNLYVILQVKSTSQHTEPVKDFLDNYSKLQEAIKTKLTSKDYNLNVIKYRMFYLKLFEAHHTLDSKTLDMIKISLRTSFINFCPKTLEDKKEILELAKIFVIMTNDKKFILDKFKQNLESKTKSLTINNSIEEKTNKKLNSRLASNLIKK